jgi:hypothetical protein
MYACKQKHTRTLIHSHTNFTQVDGSHPREADAVPAGAFGVSKRTRPNIFFDTNPKQAKEKRWV